MQRTLFSRIAMVALVPFAFATATRDCAAQVNGSVDTNFGSLNYWAVFDPVGQGDTNISGNVTELLPLPDGKVVAAGTCTFATNAVSHACLYRWTAAGFPDTSFGSGGVSLTFSGALQGVRAARRGNGAYVLAGVCNHPSFGYGLCAAAVNANGGGFDTSFGGTGQTFIPLPSGYASADFSSIAIQPDGKILIGATCYVGAGLTGNSAVCVTRLTTAAVFDTSFGTNNWSITTPGPGDALRKLIVLPDGRYFALAQCAANSVTTSYLCSGLFFSNGSFQRTLVTDVANRFEQLIDARVLGSQLSLQWSTNDNVSIANSRLHAARREAYTPSGAFDTSFGGYPSSGYAGDINQDASNDGQPGTGVILRDGSFLYFGFCNFLSPTPVLCTTQLTANGVLDTSYGVGGRIEYGGVLAPWAAVSLSSLQMYTMAEAPNGKILVAGYCTDTGSAARPCVLRINGSPQTAPTCTMDIDGDGVINATTDGLILLRAMLGISGANALANAVGTGASRSTWPQVREYLFDQCRMPVPVL